MLYKMKGWMYCIVETKDTLPKLLNTSGYPGMVMGKTLIRTNMFENYGTLFQRV